MENYVQKADETSEKLILPCNIFQKEHIFASLFPGCGVFIFPIMSKYVMYQTTIYSGAMNLFRLEKDLFPPHSTDFCMKYVTGRKKTGPPYGEPVHGYAIKAGAIFPAEIGPDGISFRPGSPCRSPGWCW